MKWQRQAPGGNMIKTIFREPKARIAMMATLLAVACWLTYYFHVVIGTGTVFTHFFYAPIILAAFWWKRKGLWVAIFLAALLIVSHSILRPDVLTANDYYRAAMFIGIAFVVAMLSERMAKSEEALKESEERYRSLVNLGGTIGEAIVMLQDTEQGDAIQTYVSKDWPRITGYSEKELLGMSFLDLLHPRYRQASLKRHKRRMRGEVIPKLFELSIIRKDGTEVPIEATSAYSTYKGERANVVFIRDITERKQMEEEEKKLMAALKRSNEELQRFAYVASHDLQEPLRMVASFTQLLAQRYQGKLDKDADEFIGYAVDGANRMQALLNDLLVYSRVESQGKPFAPTDCEHILSQAQDNVMVAIEESGAVITHDPLPTIMGDEGQLVQLFQNLLSNAVKFRGKKSPQVHVSAKQEKNEWVFSIRDNGVGIASEYFNRIFVIFQRLHGRDYPGTGAGLAICQRIVERHQGRIWVESQPGKGSTFYFTIPKGGDK